MNTIQIKGMSCQHCVASVKKAMEELPGVSSVSVDLEKNQASYDGEVENNLINEVISKIGFEVLP